MNPTKAYSATSATSPLASTTIPRRDPTDRDVRIEILFCGVCHSDLHFARNEWGFTQYPAVPGHEIVGRVTAVGAGGEEVQGRRHRRRGLPGGLARTCRARLPRGLRAILPAMIMTYGRMDKHLNPPTSAVTPRASS